MIVVTGGAGFIGSNLVAAIEKRDTVAVCDRLGDGEKWRNIAKRELAAIVTPEGLFEFLDNHSSSIDAIAHMGAISSTTETNVERLIATNIELSRDLWGWCSRHHVRLIYASSAATYGAGEKGFDDDGSVSGLARLHPLNAYGWSKHAFDRHVARVVASGEPRPPQWIGLKFFNVYGPNEYHKGPMKSVVAQLYPRAANGEAARLFRSHNPNYRDGGQMRDFVWVGDCVDVMMWLLDHPGVSGLFNMGTGKARSFADLTTAVYRALNRSPRIEYVDTPPEIRDKYQYFTEARMDRLRRAGYARPFTELEDGVGHYVRDFLAAPDPYL